MRKFIVPSALLSLCVLLIVFSDACLAAASAALSAWWERVLPALLPFSVFLSLSNSAGAFELLEKLCRPLARKCRISPALAPCILFGMLSGYPNGARLCAMRGIPLDAAFCSFCSPVFLLGVVAHGLYGRSDIFLPLIIAHTGSGLLTVLPRVLPVQTRQQSRYGRGIMPSRTDGHTGGFFPVLRESLTIMASIGGCMVLFSVGIAMIERLRLLYPIAELLQNTALTEADLLAVLHGVFEFAGGCVSIAALSLPLRIRIAMTAFTVGFGGLCVLMQSAMFLERDALWRYAWIKLMQGLLAAVLAYYLVPHFCPDMVSVMASTDEMLGYAANALSMGSVLLSSCTVLLSFYLFALALERFTRESAQKRTRLY